MLSTCKSLRTISALLLFLIVQVCFAKSVQGQTSITLQGRVVYSTSPPAPLVPAEGVTVTMTKTDSTVSPPAVTTQTTTTGGDGRYSFQSVGQCAVSYSFKATSSEIVDDEPLQPAESSISGCVMSNQNRPDMNIHRPHQITLGGYIKDVAGRPMQGVPITMKRTKYNLNPPVVTTTATVTDAAGHYQFQTFSRCSVVEELRWSLASYSNGIASPSGCVLIDYDNLDSIINLTQLQNAGVTGPCVGRPINVTNGNVYLQQTDYQLPGAGEAIYVTRTYNSLSQIVGLFGRSWTTVYDETVIRDSGTNLLHFTMADGRVAIADVTPDFFGQIVQNGDGTYTVTLKDGSVHSFNTTGRLVSLTDAMGNQTLLSYSGGKLATITDPFGRMLTVNTNSAGRVTSLSDGLGTIATYQYSSSNELLSVTYPDASKYQFAYVTGPNGLIISEIRDALGNLIEKHQYDSSGRATTSEADGGVEKYTLSYVSATETDVTDALGHLTKYFFNSVRGRSAVTRIEGVCSCGGPGNQVQTQTYDNQLNVTAKTDALNHTSTFTYDANGNRLTETDVTGTVTYTYNQFGQVLTRTDQMNGVTTNTYDAQGNLLTTKDALNNTTTFTYDSHGQPLTIADARGKVTSFTWDSSGRLTQVKDALNHTTGFAYDARARLTSATNALNQTTSFEYDLAGRLKKAIFPDTKFVTNTYDLAGRRTKLTDARGNDTTFAYDSAYRLTSVTDALSHATAFGYDLMSNQTSMTDAIGRETNYEYDDFNRLKKVIYPPATTGATRLQETIEYDPAGNITKKTDTAGRDTTYLYDAVNRLTKVTDPALQATQFEYNARSQTTGVLDALGQHYTFAYDALGRTTGMTRASVSMSFVYDAVGNQTQRTDYNGATTNYSYDDLNRLTTITYPDSNSVRYGYDALLRLTSAVNENGTVAFSYDNRGRVSSTTDVFNKTAGYSYDDNGNRTAMTVGGSTYTSYSYDAVNRLAALADSSQTVADYNYDATNKQTSRNLVNGVVSTIEYDGLDHLTHLRDAKEATLILDNQYSYNTANQISQKVDLSGTHGYGYDVVNRLTSATHTGATAESYSYDAVGNRTAAIGVANTSYTLSAFNRLTSTNLASYSYDNNGNMTSKTVSSATTAYSWDFENRLTQVTLPNTATVSYKYDALGRRIERNTSNGDVQKFVYDGQDVIQDLNDSGQVVISYLNGPGIDNKVRQTDANGNLYYSADHLGSSTALTNDSGAMVVGMGYDSFGNSSGSSLTRYTYTSRESDSDTSLMYYRARWYDPQVGRFISEDPIGFAGGDSNLYGYVWQNPLRYRDPLGLDGWGNDFADWLDRKLGGIHAGLTSDPHAVYFNTAANYAHNTWRGTADQFRVGSGVGKAIYDPCDDDPWGHVLQDVGRASAIVLTLAGPAAGPLASARAAAAGKAPGLPTLPEFIPGGKTSGILRTPSGDISLQSGWQGPASNVPRGTSGFDIVTRTHVEGHAAAVMRQQGITRATVSINNPQICVSCTRLLPRMLPPGSRLTVVLPDGTPVPFTGGP